MKTKLTYNQAKDIIHSINLMNPCASITAKNIDDILFIYIDNKLGIALKVGKKNAEMLAMEIGDY